MDDQTKAESDEVSTQVGFATDEVSAALEGGEDARQLAAGRLVEELVRRWNDLKARMAQADRDRVDIMRLDRRVTDLRRAAAQLTQRMSGSRVDRAVDAGQVPFLLRRDPPKSLNERVLPSRDRPRYTTGGEVDAWCGKCGDVREHRIVAMVGEEPKQVICDTCGSKHGYRTTPARAKGTGAPAPATPAERSARDAADREAQKRADVKRKLQQELADCAEPRPFDPKARYKAGEIIVHPAHGRGKIENVLRSSMLVRFLDGLRPLDLS
jgi:hypothetical protein